MEEEAKAKSVISAKIPAVKGAAAGIAAGVVITLLFGLLAHRWVIAVLAGACVVVGVFCMVFTLCYFKQAERYYKEHPPKKEEEEAPAEGAPSEE